MTCLGLCLVLSGSKLAEFQPSLSLEEVVSLLFLFFFFFHLVIGVSAFPKRVLCEIG